MKLLSWMHRKVRANETLKDFTIGNPCTCLTGQQSLDDHYQKPSFGNKNGGKLQRDSFLMRSSFASSLEAARGEDDDFYEESSAAISEFFHGFLTIGTLGSEPNMADPTTPTFPNVSVDNITEKETEVTENDLKMINDELEKVLGVEDGCNESSGRNSHVSNGRSSHGSTITLSGKPLEAAETVVCPLQGYLFGSGVEVPETPLVKKEHRTSLGELFQRTKVAEENCGGKCERGEKRTDKETEKSAIHLMKKLLKKRIIHSSLRSSSTDNGGNTDSVSTEKKLKKILHMFHRKVYPESSISGGKTEKPYKNEPKNMAPDGEDNCGDSMISDEDIMIIPHRRVSKEKMRRVKSYYNPGQAAINGSDSNGNRECWIKTDDDYLVLEL